MLHVSNIHKGYRNEHGLEIRAAENITFEVPEGEMFTLLGPSGCGKTTTLRCIAGLERPNTGEIKVNNVSIFSSSQGIFVPPNKRDFGMVFQSYAIWPHMTVYKNVAFPLEVERKHSRATIRDRVMEALHTVALGDFADRKATNLSGGQQQRLALARALVKKPKILLLDEPLSNLDAKLRERMRFELKKLQREMGITTLYVTHDQGEALALSHKIAVMNDGRIIQLGRPREIYGKPNNRFVADFVGSTNLITATIAQSEGRNIYRASTALGQLQIHSAEHLNRGDAVIISIRPENIELMMTPSDASNTLRGVIDASAFLGDLQDLQISVGAEIVQVRAHPLLEFARNTPVYLKIDPSHCSVIKN